MAAPILKLAQIASKVFGVLSPEKITSEHLLPIIQATNKITEADVKFDPQEIEQRDALAQRFGRKAPVTYMHMYQDDSFIMAVFVVKAGNVLPLHDHPRMQGLLKVIYGSVKIISYTEVEEKPLPESIGHIQPPFVHRHLKTVKKHDDIILTEKDDCCVLTPSMANIHEIHAETKLAAFLDILAPPYESDHSCHYYKELYSDKSQDTRWLLEIPQPASYWCDTVKYRGPSLNL